MFPEVTILLLLSAHTVTGVFWVAGCLYFNTVHNALPLPCGTRAAERPGIHSRGGQSPTAMGRDRLGEWAGRR